MRLIKGAQKCLPTIIPRTKVFQDTVWGYYKIHKRSFHWRNTKNPYNILVSEVMLQQTQVARVKGYYATFLKEFPTHKDLARAPLSKVLTKWKGLGYNRRAVNLQKACKEVVEKYKGSFPKNYNELISLPGIGQSTAGALMNFSYNIPTPFIETNIRSVYLHFFFKNKTNVTDKEIVKLVEKTQDTTNPREWYYALYDYGTMLKTTFGNQNTQSKHYKKQSVFKGSNRELRANMLFYILNKKKVSIEELILEFKKDKSAILANLGAFEKEEVLQKVGNFWKII